MEFKDIFINMILLFSEYILIKSLDILLIFNIKKYIWYVL